VQHAGTELSYLNLFDADAAWRLAYELVEDSGQVATVIVKHANACGAAVAPALADAYRRALSADELSAFGGIVAVTGALDEPLAQVIAEGPQADVIVATSMTPEAVSVLKARRKATRLLSCPPPTAPTVSLRTIGDAVLVQDPDGFGRTAAQWRTATRRAPSHEELADLVVAWRVCARTSSNAIVLAKDGTAVGIGAGQQSRVAAAELAVARASERAKGAVAASDAFFPFADGLTTLIEAGVTAVVQPGGSVRDAEMVEVADGAGVAMLLTDERHFRH
jgi:phosphoribosylaminoimidazolecarboxamide formyltransferase/IMP cyclohydrolase